MRWFSILLGVIVVLLVSLHFAVKYYSNEILRSITSNVISYKSDNLYQLRWADSNISLLRGEVTVSYLSFAIDSARLRQLQAQGRDFRYLYEFDVQQAELGSSSLKALLLNKELLVDRFLLQQPEVRIRSFGEVNLLSDAERVNNLADLIAGYLKLLKVRDFSISGACLDLLHSTAEAPDKPYRFNLEGVTVNVENFQVDSTTIGGKGRPFLLSSFKAAVRAGQINLPGSPYRLFMQSLQLSSMQNSASTGSFRLLPDSVHTLGPPPVSLLQFEGIEIGGLNYASAWFDSTLLVNTVVLKKPVVKARAPDKQQSSTALELKTAFTNVFKAVEVGKITMDSARLDITGNDFSPVQLNNCSVTLHGFGYDLQNFETRARRIFSDDVELTIRNYATRLADNFHQLKVREAGFSTITASAWFNNLLVSPLSRKPGVRRMVAAEKDKLLKFYCTRALLDGVDLWDLYLNKQLDAGKLRISGPDLEVYHYSDMPRRKQLLQLADSLLKLRRLPYDSLRLQPVAALQRPAPPAEINKVRPLPNSTARSENSAAGALHGPATSKTDSLLAKGKQQAEAGIWAEIYPMLQQSVKTTRIGRVEIADGSLNWQQRTMKDTTELFSASEIDIDLQRFLLDKSVHLDSSRMLFARQADISLSSIELHLPDSIHLFTAGNLSFSSTDTVLRGRQVALMPLSRDFYFIKEKLNERPHIFQAELQGFSLRGFPLQKALLQKNIEVRDFELQKPRVVHFFKQTPDTLWPPQQSLPAVEESVAAGTPVSALFNKLNIGQVRVTDGEYSMARIQNFTETIFRAADVNARLYRVSLDSTLLARDSLQFRLEDARITARDYLYYLPDELHRVEIEELGMSVGDSVVYASNMYIKPRPWLSPADTTNTYNILVPRVRVEGIPLMQVQNGKNMVADRFVLGSPVADLRLFNSTIIEKKKVRKKVKLENLFDLIAGSLDTLHIKEFAIEQGRLQLVNTRDQRVHQVKTGFINVDGQNFFLDSLAELDPERFLYADNITFQIKNYVHQFPDERHTLRLNEMLFNTRDAGFEASYVHYAASNWADAGFLDRRADAQNSYDVYIPVVKATGIGLYGLYMYDSLGMANMDINNPKLRMLLHRQQAKDPGRLKNLTTDSLYHLVRPAFSDFNIGSFATSNLSLELAIYEPQDSSHILLNNMDVAVENFEVDSNSYVTDPRFLHANNLGFVIRDYEFDLPDSIYRFRAGEVGFSTGDSSIFIKGMEVKPRYSKQEIAQVVGHETDWMRFASNELRLKGLDFYRLANKGELDARHLNVHGLDTYVYRDKRPPEPMNHYPKMPQELIRGAGLYLNIDTLHLYNSRVTYEELAIGATEPGRITFEELDTYAFNLTNDAEKLRDRASLQVFAEASLMGAGNMYASFDFPLASKTNAFTYRGRVDKMDLQSLNNMLENVASVKINSGTGEKLEFEVKADEEYADGIMKFYYDDLRVSLIDQETKRQGFGKAMTSFIANLLLVKSDNPRFLFLKRGKIYHPRPVHKSVFNYMAKTLLSGIKHSVGFSNTKPPRSHRKSVFEFWKKRKGF